MNIFLIGFMGSGKSSVGRRLASQLKVDFLDSDRIIEKEEGKKISLIFEEEGEEYFRTLETDFLRRLETKKAVISLGGGTPCSEENMKWMKQKGKSVYITLSPKALSNRLVNSKNPRPLLKEYQGNPEALLAFIESKLKERESYYLQADVHLDGMSVDAQKLEQLVRLLEVS